MEIRKYLSERKKAVEQSLDNLVPAATGPFSKHIEAMRYSLFAGGKRVRPILCLAAADAVGVEEDSADALFPIACALECIHTYSLIHDDLPAMDDDALRRGKATSHILFGEAGAILAGDGLLTLAFELLSDPAVSVIGSDRQLEIINLVSSCAGPLGMVGGQSLDMEMEQQEFPFSTLEQIHRSKTGALIRGSVLAGAIGAGCDGEQKKALEQYGVKIGLAFQIVDDLLNATATTKQLGKAAGSDAEKGKATYPAYFGIDETRKMAASTVNEAVDSLADFDERAEPLRELARYIYTRSN